MVAAAPGGGRGADARKHRVGGSSSPSVRAGRGHSPALPQAPPHRGLLWDQVGPKRHVSRYSWNWRDVPPILSVVPGDLAVALGPVWCLVREQPRRPVPLQGPGFGPVDTQCWVASSVQERTGRCPQASARLGAVIQLPDHLSALLRFAAEHRVRRHRCNFTSQLCSLGTRSSTAIQASRRRVCSQDVRPGGRSYGPSPLLRAGDLSDGHSFKELLGKWGGGLPGRPGPSLPGGSAHPPCPGHMTSMCVPPCPRARSF